MVCSVKGCKEKCEGSWIDIRDDSEKGIKERYCGRMSFCEKHFNAIMPFLKRKEKEMQKQEGKSNCFWAFVPLSVVNESLKQ